MQSNSNLFFSVAEVLVTLIYDVVTAVFNHENAEFFLLHDVYLPSFPLALQWIDFNKDNANEAGTFAAMGYISNEIDVWDLTVTGSLEPTLSLSNKKSGKGKRHTKAVMDLSWNKNNR